MRKRFRILVAALLVVILGGLAWLAMRPSEPVYQGKGLSVWLRDLRANSPAVHQRAVEALHEMGTNALPALHDMFRAQDSRLKMKLIGLLQRQSLVRVRIPMARDQRIKAAWACVALGPVSKPLIPDLLAMTKEQADDYNVPLYALGGMGDVAVMPLVLALTNKNSQVRQVAAGALGLIGRGASNAVPALAESLHDADAGVRMNAALSLGAIRIASPEAVSALAGALSDRDSAVRCNAAASLSELGPEAKGIAPSLSKLLNDPDESVRMNATNALKAVDPEAGAKARVK